MRAAIGRNAANKSPMPLFNRQDRQQLKLASRVGSVGIELVLATMVGWFGGQYLDEVCGTGPYLSYVGFAVGVFAGFRGLAYLVGRTNLDEM